MLFTRAITNNMSFSKIYVRNVFFFCVLFGNLGASFDVAVVPCEDEDLDCQSKVESGACLGRFEHDDGSPGLNQTLAAAMLSRCRVSCRRWAQRQSLDEGMQRFLDNLGGVEDTFESLFGGRISICDLSKGWTAEARMNLIDRKLMAATFLRSKRFGPRRYTEKGFEKTKVPAEIWEEIKRLHADAEGSWQREVCKAPGIYSCQAVSDNDEDEECLITDVTTMLYHNLNASTQNQLATKLAPLAEKWAGGVELAFSNAYGFRRYLRGAKVEGHTDSPDSKVISAIINVSQDVDGHPWPLNILDHAGNLHKVFMEPGDLVWYESAKIPHGREEVFRGRHYDNMFVHFFPSWYRGASEEEIMFPSTHDKGKTRFDQD